MAMLAYRDLRQFLSMVEDFGELKKIYGVENGVTTKLSALGGMLRCAR